MGLAKSQGYTFRNPIWIQQCLVVSQMQAVDVSGDGALGGVSVGEG